MIKIPCTKCAADILLVKAKKTGGLCMPCDQEKKRLAQEKKEREREKRLEAGRAQQANNKSQSVDDQLGLKEATEEIVQFAMVLFRKQPSLVKAFAKAYQNPQEFLHEYSTKLGYDFDDDDDPPEPWELLIDFANVHGWLWEIDWKEAPEEIVSGIKGLVPASSVNCDWTQILIGGSELPTAKFLRYLANELNNYEVTLVCFDRGNDSYPLSLMRTADVATARQLLELIDSAKIVLFEQ